MLITALTIRRQPKTPAAIKCISRALVQNLKSRDLKLFNLLFEI